MNPKISNLPPDPSPPLRGSASPRNWTAAQIAQTLTEKLELALGRHFQPSDRCPANKLYVGLLLATHFHLAGHIARELADHCVTIRDLLDQLNALLCPDLFPATPLHAEARSSGERETTP